MKARRGDGCRTEGGQHAGIAGEEGVGGGGGGR